MILCFSGCMRVALAPETYVCVLECVLAMEGVCGDGFCVSLGVCLKTSVVECAFVLVV